MPQLIEVPGKGQVEFPDEMSDEDISAAIQADSAPERTPEQKYVDRRLAEVEAKEPAPERTPEQQYADRRVAELDAKENPPEAEDPSTVNRRLRGETFKMLRDSERVSESDLRNVADPNSGIAGGLVRMGKNTLGRSIGALGRVQDEILGRDNAEAGALNDVVGSNDLIATRNKMVARINELAKNGEKGLQVGDAPHPKALETLDNFIKYYEGNGVTDGKQMASLLKDSIRENVWDATSDDEARVLSDGSIRVNPKFVADPDEQKGLKAIQDSKATPEEKAQETASFEASRKLAAKQFNDRLIAEDEGDYRKHVEDMRAQGITDPEKVFFSWDGLNRGWIKSSWDVVRDTVSSGLRGIANQARSVEAGAYSALDQAGPVGDAISTAFGVTDPIRAIDKLSGEGSVFDKVKDILTPETAKDRVAEIGNTILASHDKDQYNQELAAARGENGLIPETIKGTGSSVVQMLPMFASGALGRALGAVAETTAAEAAAGRVAAAGVYGSAAAQGYGSMMETALVAARDKAREEGKDLTPEDISKTVWEAQGPALANGFQTAVLSKLLPEGSEKAAFEGLLAKGGQISGRDVLAAFGGADGLKAAFAAAKPELKEFVKQAYTAAKVGFKDEALEEGLNQFIEGAITRATVQPDKSWDDIGQETFQGAWQGGLVGGGLPLATHTLAERNPQLVQAQRMAVEAQKDAPDSAQAAMATVQAVETGATLTEETSKPEVTEPLTLGAATPEATTEVSETTGTPAVVPDEEALAQPVEQQAPPVEEIPVAQEPALGSAEPIPDLGSFEASRQRASEAHRAENSALGEIGDRYNALEEKWAQEGTKLTLKEPPKGEAGVPENAIYLEAIAVPKEKQGQGVGSKVLTDVKALSDETGKPIYLVPTEIGGTEGGLERLNKFYEANGFTPVDRGTSRSGRTRSPGYQYDPKAQTPTLTISEGGLTTASKTRQALPYSTENLRSTFDLTPEQAEATDALVQSMGLDTDRIQLTRGGKIGSGIPGPGFSYNTREKGSVDFLLNGKFLVRAMGSPDVSTALHEISHIARNTLFNRETPVAGITPEDIATAEEWAGAKDGNWGIQAEEKFARGFERYLRDGEAPTPALKGVFDKIGEWMRNIYHTLVGSSVNVEISEPMRQVFDRLVSRNLPESVIPETSEKVEIPAKPAEGPSPTGLAHAVIDREREVRGLPQLFSPAAQTDADAWASAVAAEDKWKANANQGTAGAALLTQALNDPGRILDKNEKALLLHEKLIRQQEVDRAYHALNTLPEGTSKQDRMTAAANVDKAQQAFDTLTTYARALGSASGRTLQAQKMLVNQDFSLATLLNRRLAAKNTFADSPQKLTESEIKDTAALAQRLQEVQRRADALTSESAEHLRLIEKLTAEVDTLRGKARQPQNKSFIRKVLSKQIEAAKARLEEAGVKSLKQAAENPSPAVLRDLSIVGAGWLVDEALDLAKFTGKLVSTFGDWAGEHAETIFKKALGTYDEAAGKASGRRQPSSAEIIDSLNPDAVDRAEVFQLARAFVAEGARGEEVLDKTHAALQAVHPELTRDGVAKTFTDYGRITYPSKDEVSVELNKVRQLERIALKVADLKAGKAPLRTGFQRGEMDAEIRAAEKEYRALLKETGIQVTDPETQLRSALGATKRRMENEIEELQQAIDKGQPRVNNSTPLAYDEEANALRSRLEAKRAEYDQLFGTGMTPEKRVQATLRSLDRQIAEEERMLKDGILKRPKGQPVEETPEIAEKRRQLAEMRQNRRDLYEAAHPNESALAQAKTAAQRSIDRLKSVLEGNAQTLRNRQKVAPDAELQALWDVRESLSDEVAELRRQQPLTPEQEQRQVKQALAAAEKALERVQTKLRNNDLSVPEKTSTPASRDAAVQAVRSQVQELNKELARRRQEAKPKLSPEEARLKRVIASAQQRKAELERRIREKDFTPKTSPEPLNTPETRRLNYELSTLKSEYNEMVAHDRLENAPWYRVAGHYAGSIGLLSKLVKLGGDLGVVFRQLGGLTYQSLVDDFSRLVRMVNPLGDSAKARQEWKEEGSKLVKTLGTGLKAFFNPEYESQVYEEILNRPMAGYDKVAGMVYNEPHDTAVLQKDDIPRADLLKTLPGWIWPALAAGKWALFGMSPPVGLLTVAIGALTKPGLLALDRAQRTMTNQARALWFDHAMKSLASSDAVSAADAKIIGRAVMIASGRGTLGKAEAAVPVANMLLNATRFYASRIQAIAQGAKLANPLAWKKNPEAMQEVAKMYGRSIAGRAAMYTLVAALLGKKNDDDDDKPGIVMNPLSSDFGKIRLTKNLSMDFMSGINSFGNILAKVITKKKVDSKGHLVNLTAEQRNNLNDEVLRFLKSKRNINLGFVWDTWQGAYFGGKKATFKNAVDEATSMIIFDDTKNIFQELGPVKGAIAWSLMFGGAGASVKKPKKPPVDDNP